MKLKALCNKLNIDHSVAYKAVKYDWVLAKKYKIYKYDVSNIDHTIIIDYDGIASPEKLDMILMQSAIFIRPRGLNVQVIRSSYYKQYVEEKFKELPDAQKRSTKNILLENIAKKHYGYCSDERLATLYDCIVMFDRGNIDYKECDLDIEYAIWKEYRQNINNHV